MPSWRAGAEVADLAIVSAFQPYHAVSLRGHERGLLAMAAERQLAATLLAPPAVFQRDSYWRSGGDLAWRIGVRLDQHLVRPAYLLGRRCRVLHAITQRSLAHARLVRHEARTVSVHDLIDLLLLLGRLRGPPSTRLQARLIGARYKALEQADRIVCVSETTRRDLLALTGVDPARVRVIRNPLFQSLPRPPAADLARCRAALDLPPTAPVVLHVGFESWFKNKAGVLAVFARLARRRPDLHLVMLGRSLPTLTERARALGPGDRIRLIPSATAEQLAALYATASVLLFPSHYEGFGNPVLEAQACGLPVVCSTGGALPEVVGDGAVLRDPADEEGLAEAVLQVLEDGTLAASLVARGRDNVARFTPAAWRDGYAGLFGELLGRPVPIVATATAGAATG